MGAWVCVNVLFNILFFVTFTVIVINNTSIPNLITFQMFVTNPSYVFVKYFIVV